jgi:phosphoribosylformylglycinamidine synthase
MKPKTLIFSGYGINCEEETAYAYKLAGADPKIVHINDIIDGQKKLSDYQILTFPGGFSYGDDTGSGNAYAHKVRNTLWEQLSTCIQKDKLVLGICNGFQILVNLGLLPAINRQYGERQAALLTNTNPIFINRWVDLKITSASPWLKGISDMSLPIAHGEGRFFADKTVIGHLNKKSMIVARYTKGEICSHFSLEPNPNGSIEDIAGITDETGRILGLMPHPERGMLCTQLPHWPWLKEQYKQQTKKLPEYADGLQIFKNAVRYFG